MTDADRRAALERLRPLLGAIASEAGGDPLLLAEFALLLLAEAKHRPRADRCDEGEGVDRVLWVAALAMVEAAGWGEPGWTRAAWTLSRVFERAEFAEVAGAGIGSLPEVDG